MVVAGRKLEKPPPTYRRHQIGMRDNSIWSIFNHWAESVRPKSWPLREWSWVEWSGAAYLAYLFCPHNGWRCENGEVVRGGVRSIIHRVSVTNASYTIQILLVRWLSRLKNMACGEIWQVLANLKNLHRSAPDFITYVKFFLHLLVNYVVRGLRISKICV